MSWTLSTNKLAQALCEINAERGIHEPWEELDDESRQAYRYAADGIMRKLEEQRQLEQITKDVWN